MRNLRRGPLCKSSFFLFLLVTGAGLVPVARSRAQARVNHPTTLAEETAAGAATQHASASAPAVDRSVLTTGVGAQGAASQARRTESTAPLPKTIPPILLPPATYLTSAPNAVAVADVNGDGKPDIVAANCLGGSCSFQEEGTVSVFLGNGDGTFQNAVTYPSGGDLPTSVAVADVNGDGKPDILVANQSYGINMLLGNGDGTFQPVVSVAGIASPQQVLVADVNHDGKPDVVVLAGSVEVLLGNGDGTFLPVVSYSTCCLASSLAMADVNGDGKLDLLVSYWDAGWVGIQLGNGDGTFQSETLIPAGVQPSWLAAADVNGDGHIDLVATNLCLGGCNGSGTVSVLLGNGDGTFQAPASYGWDGYGATSVAIADMNADGKPDLVIGGASCDVQCGPGPTGIAILLGKGDGTFEATLEYAPYSDVGSNVLVKDLNGDHRPDVVSIHSSIDGWLQVWLHVGSIHTTTALTSSLNPSVFGQSVTVTANVRSSSGTPTGTVELFDNSSDCFDSSSDCGGEALVNGIAVFPNLRLSAGSHTLIAAYQGSLLFNSNTSNQPNQVVKIATTTTSVVSSLNPATPLRKFTYTATVTGQYGGATFGTVTFSDGASALATVNLASGQAAVSVSNQSCGVHPITAAYSGDANNNASTSLALNENVQCSTTTVLTTSGSPAFAGQPVTFTAKLSSRYGTIPDGETVTFYDGKTALASIPLAAETAVFTTSSLSAASHPITATYVGDAHFTSSTGRLTEKVVKYPTTTTLSSSLNPSLHGQAVTFTATVTSSGGPAPTGKVIFKNGTVSLGAPVLLSGGVASLTKSNLPVGTDSITADYLGDLVSAASDSAVLDQVVH